MATRRLNCEIFKNWEKGGKTEFVKMCRSSSQIPSSAARPPSKDLKRLLYDICWQVVQGTLRLEQLLIALSEIGAFQNEVSSALADVLNLLDIETQCSDVRDQRERYISLLNGCTQKVVPESILKERLEFDTTSDAGIIKNKKGLLTKFIKVKTKLFYKQQKFNLFREESEGYSKLISELNQEISGRVNGVYMLEVIKSLIGCFNLDPNRVLDIILESFECHLELAEFYIPLLQSFQCSSSTISQTLGFKFGFYQNDISAQTPPSLYKVAALLLQNGLIVLDQLYGLLTPADSKILEIHKQELQEAKLSARRMNMIITSSEKSDENKEDNREEEILEENQKLGLCAALLEVGDWEHGKMIMNRLPDYYAVSNQDMARKLCDLIHAVIDPLYKRHKDLPNGLKGSTITMPVSNRCLKQVDTFAKFKERALPMVLTLGPHLHLDPVLMVKIIRLAKAYMNKKLDAKFGGDTCKDIATNGLEFDILTLLDETLLPSLSLLDCNCCMAEEMWSLLKLYPYQIRYRLYSLWKSETHYSHPLLIRIRAEMLKKIKYIMKRLSKENVKPSGRQIGKLSHSNPGYLFDYILSQIQTWDNLILPVVDSLKYLTSLSYDMMAYCIIEALSNPQKDKMKHDATSISLWLQSLSSFTGAVFKKYPMELTGLLQYVANQLKAEKSLDLLVLKEIVQKMGGVEATDELTGDQLEAMSGGEQLRAEGGYFSQMRNTKKSSQRLKDALLEQDLALPLCFLMAQQRNCILYHEQGKSHLKLVGKLYDQCQDTLVQFGNFLANSLSMEDYVNKLPSIDQLFAEYHMQADVVFFLARPMINHVIHSEYEDLKKQDKALKSSTTALRLQKYIDAVEAVMRPVIESIRPLQSPKTWEDLSPQFYVTFWSLAMYDLIVPAASYDREISKLKLLISQTEENKDMAQSKKKKEKERCHALIDKLVDEEKRQQEHCTRTLARLKTEKDSWFQSRSAKNETITQFLQLCVFPRCIFTSVDALYCAKFVHLIHTLKTQNFSTLICYDRIFCDITYTVTACTENEANRYGRFLCSMLETVTRWHSDKSIFEKECANFPGFMTKFRGASQSSDSATDHVDYENYRHVCHKWHFKITKALVICLESGDFVQIRNSLIVLIRILPHFPVITNLGQALERRIEKIRQEEKEKRPDLYALATGYAGQLKGKKNSLIQEHEFHLKEMVKSQGSNPFTKAETGSKSSSAPKDGACDVISMETKTDGVKEKKPDSKLEVSRMLVGSRSMAQAMKNSSTHLSTQTLSKKDASSVSKNHAREEEYDSGHVDKAGGDRLLKSQLGPDKLKDDKNDLFTKKEKTSSSVEFLSNHDKSQSVKDDKRDKKEEDYIPHPHHDRGGHHYGISDKDLDHRREPGSLLDGGGSHQRNLDSADGEREHKRRRTDGSSSKAPRAEERSRESNEREVKIVERPKERPEDGERSSSKERRLHEKLHPVEGEIYIEKVVKLKEREKKIGRRREHSEEGIVEVKKRKDDDQSKPGKRNGDEIREKERHRREETSPKPLERGRKTEREEKKYYRSPSSTIGIKKKV